ncbi:hypothetical protein PHISP_00299 [Aspergillus sp. HF37]|nr:hypothetical protein PHISP_00299 [Aspergillus sp. HF37]
MVGSTGGDEPKAGDKGSTMMGVMWSLTMLAFVIVVTRLYIRQRLLRNLGLDDWLIVASMVTLPVTPNPIVSPADPVCDLMQGYGRHTAALEVIKAETALFWNMVSFIFGILSFAVPKLAVAALRHRILNPALIHRVIIWVLVSLVAAVAVVNILIYVTMGDPPRGLWEFSMVKNGEATCRNVWILVNYARFNGDRLATLSAFVDLYLAVYPGYVLSQLKMSLRKKIGLTGALGMGCMYVVAIFPITCYQSQQLLTFTSAAVTAIVKCTRLEGLANKKDPTYATVLLIIWTSVEANVVVIAACIPTLQPILDPILRVLGPSTTGKQSSGHRYYQQGSATANAGSYMRSKHNTRMKGNSPAAFDEASQDSIFQDRDEPFKIRRTDEVFVDYEMKGQKHDPCG